MLTPCRPATALPGHEFDVSWITLKMLNAVGIVRDLKVAKVRQVPEQQAA